MAWRSPQLCKPYTPGERIAAGTFVEPKIDGYRAVVIKRDGVWSVHSRNGNPFFNWHHITEEIDRLCTLDNLVLDGEFWTGNFNQTGSICRTEKSHPDRLEMELWVFDLLALEEWEGTSRTLAERREGLDLLGQILKGAMFSRVVPAIAVDTAQQVDEILANCIDAGYEGVVVKDPRGRYVHGRSDGWRKYKLMKDDEFVVVGMEEGKDGCLGQMGALRIVRPGIDTRVGTGFTPAMRDHYWQNPDAIIGKVVTVFYQEQMGDQLRFSAFKGVRADRDASEIMPDYEALITMEVA